MTDALLSIELRASGQLCAVLTAVHVAGYSCLWWAGLPPVTLLVAGVAFSLSLLLAIMQHGLRCTPGAVVGIRIDQQGDATVRLRNGRLHTTRIEPYSPSNRWFVVLHMPTSPARCQRVFVAATNLDEQAYRRLRVFLTTRATTTWSSR